MRLGSLALFGAGYVLGARAGRERYAQIVAAAQQAAEHLGQTTSGPAPSVRLAEYLKSATGDRPRS
jgi:hypothetical protein